MFNSQQDARVAIVEKRLAVETNWFLLGMFGASFLLTGFSASHWGFGFLGYGFLVLGFVGHLIINELYSTTFSQGEIALGLVIFAFLALSFIVNVMLNPHFGSVRLGLGLLGFGIVVLCLVLYLIIRYGMRGTWILIHTLRRR